jgi:hypothetical protein
VLRYNTIVSAAQKGCKTVAVTAKCHSGKVQYMQYRELFFFAIFYSIIIIDATHKTGVQVKGVYWLPMECHGGAVSSPPKASPPGDLTGSCCARRPGAPQACLSVCLPGRAASRLEYGGRQGAITYATTHDVEGCPVDGAITTTSRPRMPAPSSVASAAAPHAVAFAAAPPPGPAGAACCGGPGRRPETAAPKKTKFKKRQNHILSFNGGRPQKEVLGWETCANLLSIQKNTNRASCPDSLKLRVCGSRRQNLPRLPAGQSKKGPNFIFLGRPTRHRAGAAAAPPPPRRRRRAFAARLPAPHAVGWRSLRGLRPPRLRGAATAPTVRRPEVARRFVCTTDEGGGARHLLFTEQFIPYPAAQASSSSD